ncbi:MAG: superoxide dismutase family protein [Acidobacteria bacterium]|nr:superoxide dismutase family protein [Acidobacteriota bacterium]
MGITRLISLVSLAAAGALMLGAQGQPEARIYRAKATIRGAAGSGVSGVVRFTQVDGGILPTVLVEAEIIGLQPGARHGFHIHERGNCSDTNPVTGAAGAFVGAGGHFDPGPKSDSNPDANHPFHMGDLPNIQVNEFGVGYLRHTTSRVTLSPGPLTIFDPDDPTTAFDDTDSAVILHVNEDQGTTGTAGGAGGARLACGIIDRVSGWETASVPNASPAMRAEKSPSASGHEGHGKSADAQH